jgi:hypothetical protein
MHVHATLGHESNSSLGVGRLVLREELELIVLKLKVSDIAVTAGYQKLGKHKGSIMDTHPRPAK